MRSLALGVLLALACTATATAATHPEGDCAWHQNGDEVTVHGYKYRCWCQRIPEASAIHCHWELIATPRRKIKRHAHKRLIPVLVIRIPA